MSVRGSLDVPSVVLTGIQMAVKVNDSHRAVGTVDRPEQRQCDSVITAEGDDTRQGLSTLGRANLLGVSGRCAGQ